MRDLEALLEESSTKASHKQIFLKGTLFKDGLEEFYNPIQQAEGVVENKFTMLATAFQTVKEMICDRITSYFVDPTQSKGRTSVLEELDCGHVSTVAVQQMISRVPSLQTLRVWDGMCLISAGELLRDNCPRFRSLLFYEWSSESADEEIAHLLQKLRPQSLEALEVADGSILGKCTALMLKEHNTSLTLIKIGGTAPQFIKSLLTIGSCPRLNTFSMCTRAITAIVTAETQRQLGSWLSTCTSLNNLYIGNNPTLNWSSKILLPVLLSNVKLLRLDVRDYFGQTASDFHHALVKQSNSLEYLTLEGDADDMDDDDLVSVITKLTKLRDLQLFGLSNYFSNAHMINIATSLTNLEELFLSGWDITDVIWPALSNLRSLQRLDMTAYSNFTFDGILGYVNTLGDGNRGIMFHISTADPITALTESEEDIVRAALLAKVDGRFEYMVSRGKHFIISTFFTSSERSRVRFYLAVTGPFSGSKQTIPNPALLYP